MLGSKQVGDGGTDPGIAPRPRMGDGDAPSDRDGGEGGKELGVDELDSLPCGCVGTGGVCDNLFHSPSLNAFMEWR
jgi:hypothetical protein